MANGGLGHFGVIIEGEDNDWYSRRELREKFEDVPVCFFVILNCRKYNQFWQLMANPLQFDSFR